MNFTCLVILTERKQNQHESDIFEAYPSHMEVTLGSERTCELWGSRGVKFLPGFVEYVEAHINSHPFAKDK